MALESCGSTREFLRALGLTEYVDTFESAGLLDTHALMRLSEDDFRAMGVKFGHRKKLIEVLSKMDPLYAFLQEGGLMAHYETFKEMGFDNIWSLMSIQESHRERLGLSEEEMQLVLKRRDALVESSKSAIERIPELQKVTDSSESKPILLQIFSSERADEVISNGGFPTVSYLQYYDEGAADEIGLKFGEAVGLSSLVSYIKSKIVQ